MRDASQRGHAWRAAHLDAAQTVVQLQQFAEGPCHLSRERPHLQPLREVLVKSLALGARMQP